MTIYTIKADYILHNPEGHYFDRATLRFFGQTLRDFSIRKEGEGIYKISAHMRFRGKTVGKSKAIYSFIEHKFVKEGE